MYRHLCSMSYTSSETIYNSIPLIANILDHRPLTRSLYAADLVRESEVKLERRENKTLKGVLRGQVIRVFGNGSHISIIQCHQVAVALNPRGVHRLGKDGRATADYTEDAVSDNSRIIRHGRYVLCQLSRTVAGSTPFFFATSTMGSAVSSGLPVLPRGLYAVM